MSQQAFLPIGTIVILKGSEKKMMIVSRLVITSIEEEVVYFEYGACAYPEGMVGDTVRYFNSDEIVHVVHHGFADGEDVALQERLIEVLEHIQMMKGHGTQ